MKKTYIVQFIIDIIVIVLGILNYFWPRIRLANLNIIFFIEMMTYAMINISEYIFDSSKKEPLYLCIISYITAFACLLLKDFSINYVLPIAILIWCFFLAIIRIISLENIYKKRVNLFLIKLSEISIFTLIAVLVSINLYFQVSVMTYLLAFLFISYGVLELFVDFLTFLSENPKFLKE